MAQREAPRQKYDDGLISSLHMHESQVNGRVRVSTLRQLSYISAKALNPLYAMRWNIEVDFRVIKATLGMDVLRRKLRIAGCLSNK